MADERPKEPEIKVSEDGINANFNLFPRLDQPPSRPMGSALRRSHHHHNRNHSIDTKDRTSPILGFGPLNSPGASWSTSELGGSDHYTTSPDPNQSMFPNDSLRAPNGSYDPSRSKPVNANMFPSARKVSAGSSTSSSSSTGSASPDVSVPSDLRRPGSRSVDRYQPNGTASHHFSEASTRRTASPARSFSGAPISPRLQATMSAHAGIAHARRASADLSTSPFRAPSPIFLASSSPPAGPTNSDPQHSWDSVWPRSSTPDRADQLRRIGSSSPVAGSPGRSSPSALSDSINLSRSPSASFDSSSPAGTSATILGRPKARRPHELRGSSSSPILRMSPGGLRDAHNLSSSPRRSIETARTEPIIKIGFQPPSGPGTPTDGLLRTNFAQSPVSKVLSPATELPPQVDIATALVSHRNSSTGSSWLPERVGSPSATFAAADPRKRPMSVPVPHALPLPTRTPSPKMSPTSPRSPFLELSASSPGPNGSHGLGESPPKTRSFIAMPPRSGYDLSDDPDDVGSEEDGSNSERESVGTNDEDYDGSEYDEDDITDTADADDDDAERDASSNVNGIHDDDEHNDSDEDAHRQQVSKDDDQEPALPERSLLPKRPSLTRSGVVPPPITVIEPPRGPMDPMAQAEASARALAAQKGSPSSAMLNYFRDEPSSQEAPQLDLPGDAQLSDAVIPSALGLDAGEVQPTDAMMEEGGADSGEEDDDQEEQGFEGASEDAEESLNMLERIFLFAKSDMASHRGYVSQLLPDWIREVELSDAVEYIIPLLHGLATDELDVCTAFAPEIGRVMWFFFRSCPLGELADESSDMQPADDDQEERVPRPKISVTAFTTLLCALLLNQNTVIASATQQSLVHFFYRLDRRDLEFSKEELAEKSEEEVKARQQEQDLESYITHASGRDGQPVPHEDYPFDNHARAAVKNELLENVALALAQLNHGRHGIEHGAEENEQAEAQSGSAEGDAATKSTEAGEAMEEDAVDNQDSSKSTSEMNKTAEVKASTDDAMDEGQDHAQFSSSWTQDNNGFGQQSDGSVSDVQIDEDEESAVGRMASVSLLAALAADELIPQDTLLNRLAPEVLKLIEDSAFYVRKEVASSLGPFSRKMSVEAVEQTILPALNKAIHDRNWHVRQAACFSIPVILGRLDEKQRREQTLTFMRALVNDVSRQLRIAALEIIGEVIYMFHEAQGGVPEELIRFFLGEPFDGPPQQGDASLTFDKTSDPEGTEALFEEESAMMMDHDNELGMPASLRDDQDSLLASFGYGGNESSMMDAAPWDNNFRVNNIDPERPLVVAFNLPAVVLTLGADQWGRLKQTHAELTQSDKPKIRKSLAASLHEVAKIVGQEATRDDLLPAATRFITDDDPEVRLAMFDNMDVFLSCLPQIGAEKMLWQLVSLWTSDSLRDWRLRERLALHIPSMAKQFLTKDEEGNLVSLMQLALADPISAVRDAGIHCVPNLYKAFAEHEQVIADGFLGMVSDLGDSPGYRMRVACLHCIGALVESGIQRSSCELLLLSRLNQMGDDSVVDVRIALARVLGQMCRKDELYAQPQSRSEDLNKLIAKLARDRAWQVQEAVSGILSEEEVEQLAGEMPGDEETPRKLVLGPADGGPHRPEGEGGFTNNFVDANGDDSDVHVFQMDDDSNADEDNTEEKNGEGDSGTEGSKEGSGSMTQAQSAQHLEMSRASIFGGVKRGFVDFGSDWVTANGTGLLDYEDKDEDDEIEDVEGLDEEPHHLLNVDRDSNDSGELIDDESPSGDGEAKPSDTQSEEGEESQAAADNSMEEGDSTGGITLSSPQRGLDGAVDAGNDGDSSVDSPSRTGGSGGKGGGKAADPFLAFVAGRRSQDLSRLDLSGRVGASRMGAKRSRLSNGTAATQQTDDNDDEGEVLLSPTGDEEMMGTRYLSKNSGDWSQLRADTSDDSKRGKQEASNDDDFVEV